MNVVLNSLAEEKLQASIRCLARHGRFLEIGKYDLSNNSPLGKYGLSLPQLQRWQVKLFATDIYLLFLDDLGDFRCRIVVFHRYVLQLDWHGRCLW